MKPTDAQLGATLEALAALRAGSDPRRELLDGLLERTAARRVVWIPAGEESAAQVRYRLESDALRSADELPRELPWPVLLDLAPGSSRRLGPDWLTRWPGQRALGNRQALAGRSAEGARLWIESQDELDLRQVEFRGWLRTLAEFETLDRERRDRLAADALVRRGAAAAGVAHDLRNQLSLAGLELARLRELGDLNAGGDALARTLRAAQALSHSFLTPAAHAPVTKALRGLLEDELRAAVELVQRPGVRARLKCARGLALDVDEVLLRRILRNLLLNALHATDDGGSVQLSATAIDDQRIEIAVQDDGRGMDERQLERWMRAGSSGRGSTGFGTTSVLDCVRELDADLAIESTLGEGTRCAIKFARAEAGSRSAVLICELDPIRRRRLARRFEDFQLTAVCVESAPRARAIFEAQGALGLVMARGSRSTDANALRSAARSAGCAILELSVLQDENRVVGEFARKLRPAAAPDSPPNEIRDRTH